MYWLYAFFIQATALCTAPIWITHLAITPKHRAGLKQRFGLYTPKLKKQLSQKQNLWIHCVSVGEFLAAEPLINELQQQRPHLHIVITTTTRTGQKLAQSKLGHQHTVLYLPVDLPFAVRAFYQAVLPQVAVIVETELWPSLIQLCPSPMLLVNARISDTSFQKYLKYKKLLTPFLKQLTTILAQSDQDKERFLALGAPPAHVLKGGQLKYDAVARKVKLAQTPSLAWTIQPSSSRVFLAASTHPGEETIALNGFNKLKNTTPSQTWKLILAPRHPERSQEVLCEVNALGLTGILFSELKQQEQPVWNSEVCIIDTIGDLFYLYASADLVMMGGSFVKHGGQNPLEPAAWGKSILCGPHMFNFKDILTHLKQTQGIVQVHTEDDFYSNLLNLAQDPLAAQQLGLNAKKCLSDHQSALETTLNTILNHIK